MLTFCSFLHRTAEYVKQIRRGKALAWLFCLLAAAGMVCADGSSLMTAFAVISAKVSNNQHKSDQAWDWLKRIWLSWAVLNLMGAILAYITPLFSGYATLP